MAAITVRAKAHTAAPIWATSYLDQIHVMIGLYEASYTTPLKKTFIFSIKKICIKKGNF